MADEKQEKPVDLTHEEIKAREQAVADDLAKRSAPDTKPATEETHKQEQ